MHVGATASPVSQPAAPQSRSRGGVESRSRSARELVSYDAAFELCPKSSLKMLTASAIDLIDCERGRRRVQSPPLPSLESSYGAETSHRLGQPCEKGRLSDRSAPLSSPVLSSVALGEIALGLLSAMVGLGRALEPAHGTEDATADGDAIARLTR